MKCIKSAYVEGKNWKQELFRFLRQYRATPHTSTGYTPFRLLFQREPSTRLPEITKPGPERKTDEIARRNDERSKSHSKEYEDRKINARERHIKIGDKVLLQNEYTVKDKKGPMVSVESVSGLV